MQGWTNITVESKVVVQKQNSTELSSLTKTPITDSKVAKQLIFSVQM